MVFGLSTCLIAAARIASSAQVEAPTIDVSLEALSVSSYIWRGVEVRRSPVMQYDATIARGSLSFGTWANVPTFSDPTGSPDEVDLTMSYSSSKGNFETNSSFVSYVFPEDSGANTTELCFDVAYAFGPSKVFISNALDVALYSGAYYGEAGFSSDFSWSDQIALDMRVGVAWASSRFNEVYFGVAKSGLNGFFGEVGLTFSNNDGTYIRPSVGLWSLTDSALRAVATRSMMITFGVAAGIEF